MSSVKLPPDPWLGVVLRRLLVVSVVILVFAHFASPTGLDVTLAEEHAPDSASWVTLPMATTPLTGAGDGMLLPPFEIDDSESWTGGWALLDRAAGEVLVLDTLGAVVRRVGRRGAGPGELERPLDVAVGPAGSVAVLDATGQRLDLFPTSGLPLRVALTAHECKGTFGDDVVHHREVWWVLRRCFQGMAVDIEVVRVTAGGASEIVTRRHLTSMSVDPLLTPLIVEAGGTLYVGNNREPCLAPVEDSSSGAPLCLPQPPPRAIPDSVAQELFGDLGQRAAAVGLDLKLPTHYPGVFATRRGPDGPVIGLIRADRSDAWAYGRGDSLRVVETSAGVRAIPGLSHWLLFRDDVAGLRLWTVPVVH